MHKTVPFVVGMLWGFGEMALMSLGWDLLVMTSDVVELLMATKGGDR